MLWEDAGNISSVSWLLLTALDKILQEKKWAWEFAGLQNKNGRQKKTSRSCRNCKVGHLTNFHFLLVKDNTDKTSAWHWVIKTQSNDKDQVMDVVIKPFV